MLSATLAPLPTIAPAGFNSSLDRATWRGAGRLLSNGTQISTSWVEAEGVMLDIRGDGCEYLELTPAVALELAAALTSLVPASN